MSRVPPTIHRCHALHKENEQLELRYRKVTRKCKKLRQEVDDLNKKLLVQESNASAKKHGPGVVSKSNTSAMNTIPKTGNKFKTIQANDKENLAGLTFEELLSRYNVLVKQFERESKKCLSINSKLRSTQQENEQLKQDLSASQQQLVALHLSDEERRKEQVQAKSTPKTEKRFFEMKLNGLKKERDDLVSENNRLKEELSGLDKGFFDEIEDVKYALQQSGKLNIQYEKALRKLCKQFNLDEQTFLPRNGGRKKTRKRTSLDNKPTSAPAISQTNERTKKPQRRSSQASESAAVQTSKPRCQSAASEPSALLHTSKISLLERNTISQQKKRNAFVQQISAPVSSAWGSSSDEEHDGAIKHSVRRPGGKKKGAWQNKKK